MPRWRESRDMTAPRRVLSSAAWIRQAFGLAAITLMLAGCATSPVKPGNPDALRQAEFDRSMDKWHGASAKELINKLGAPNSKSRLPSGTLVYTHAGATQLQGPTGPIPFSCTVRYMVDERSGLITGHRIEGC